MSRTEPTTPPEPGQPAIEVAPRSPAPEAADPAPSMEAAAAHAPESSWGVALVALVLLGIVGSIVLIAGLAPARKPAPAEQRFPLASGTTLSYRITSADGTISYQSENIERRHGTNALDLLDIPTRLLVASRITGIPLADLSAERFSAFLKTNAGQVVVARVTDTTYDQSGLITPTTNLLLVQPEQIELLASAGGRFEPPLPLLDARLSPGAERVVTGMLATSSPYTATIVLEANEALDTPVGRMKDCSRVRLTLRIAANVNDLRTWFCAGIGIARQESRESGAAGMIRYELIGVSAPALTASAERPAMLPVQAIAPADNPRSGASAQGISATLETLWSYRESGLNTHITTPVIAAGGPSTSVGRALLLYGTANGGLLALDRADHTLAWRFQTGGAIYAAPAVANGPVYVGSTDRKLYALDLRSGAFRWAFATRDAISAAPAVANGIVYVGSEDRAVYALDAQSGQER